MTLLIAALLGCSTSTSPSETVPPEEAAPAVRVDEVQAAPVAAVEEPRPVGHCASGEKAYFDCPASGGKHLSLCGSPDLGKPTSFLAYRFGPLGTPELVFPATPEDSVPRFRFEARMHVRSMGDTVQFDNGNIRYTVMAMSGSGHPGEAEANNFVGVLVEEDGHLIASVNCVGDATDHLADIVAE
jgi:hypothetical protein